jgi:hypothetical protein
LSNRCAKADAHFTNPAPISGETVRG